MNRIEMFRGAWTVAPIVDLVCGLNGEAGGEVGDAP
jgi:hypothetical protein